jgi:hypothetical protein
MTHAAKSDTGHSLMLRDRYEPWPFEQTLSHDALCELADAIEFYIDSGVGPPGALNTELVNTANAIRGFLERQVDPLLG